MEAPAFSRDTMRRESRAYFRRECDGAARGAESLADELAGLADELRRDGYYSDAVDSVGLLRRAANAAREARRLAALAEAQLPPVVR
jgi:hypothetical protein